MPGGKPVLPQLVMTGTVVGSLLGNGRMILLNLVYVQKREHLFANGRKAKSPAAVLGRRPPGISCFV